MSHTPYFIGRIILSVFLVLSLTLFVFLFSVNQVVNAESYEQIKVDIAKEIVEGAISSDSSNLEGLDYETALFVLTEQCVDNEVASIPDVSIEFSCVDIESYTPDELKSDIAEKIALDQTSAIDNIIAESTGFSNVEDIFRFQKLGWIIALFVSILLIIGIIFLSIPKYVMTFNFGIVCLFAGAPFAVAPTISYKSEGAAMPTLEALVSNLAHSFFVNYLALFIVGVLFLIVGIIWWAVWGGNNHYKMLVKDVMKKPIVVEQDASLKKASEILSKNKISSLIMVNGEEFIGVVTEQDLISHFGEELNVSQIMKKDVSTIKPRENISRAIKLMKDSDLKILPVVDKGKLVGVLGERDLLMVDKERGDFLIN